MPGDTHHQRKERQFWRRSLFASWATAGAAIAAVLFAAGAFHQARRQADTAQAALIASDRPWIEVVDLSVGDLQLGGIGAAADLTIRTKNIGRSPALRSFVDAGIVVDTKGAEVGDQAAAMCERVARTRDSFGVEGVVFPDGTRTARLRRAIGPDVVEEGLRRMRQRRGPLPDAPPGEDAAGPADLGLVVVGRADYTNPSKQVAGQTAFVYDLTQNCGNAKLVLPCGFPWPVTGLYTGDALAVEPNDFYGFAR